MTYISIVHSFQTGSDFTVVLLTAAYFFVNFIPFCDSKYRPNVIAI